MKKCFLRALCALLIITAALIPTLALTVSASGGEYDYSRPASGYNVSYSDTEILEHYLGEAVSELEAEHLSRESIISINLDTGISTSYISAEYNLADSSVTVCAESYVYITSSGSQATWVPMAIIFDGVEYPLTSENEYTVVLPDVAEEMDLYADVIYSFKCTVAKEDMNALLTKLYTDASAYSAEIAEGLAEHERLLAEHRQAVKDREDYLVAMSEYELDCAEYEIYLETKAVWDEEYAKYKSYTDYLAAVEALEYYNTVTLPKYYADKKAYEAYEILYEQWLIDSAAKAELDARKDEARRQLAILDTAFVSMTALNRKIYTAMQSGIVDEVVSRKKQLCEAPYNVDPTVVDMADKATKALRGTADNPGFLEQYKALTDESEKYDFYINNYEDLRFYFTMLVQALDKLYSNRHVRGGIVDKGKNEKYLIFVAQLALVANGLNGGYTERYSPTDGGQSVFNSAYTIDGKTISAILDGYTIDLPETPTPGENVFLLDVEAVEPEYVADPGNMPEPPPAPVWPGQAYEDPGDPPEYMAEPVEPEYVAEAGEPPAEYVPDPYKLKLSSALDRGEIAKREELGEDCALTFTKSVRKKLTNVTKYTVNFYGSVGGELLCEPQLVEEGSAVEYKGELPTKAEDVEATYRFVGWQDAEGNPFDLSSLGMSVDLYPAFEKVYKHYTVTFSVNGAEHHTDYMYGEIPVFLGDTSREDDEYFRYTHTGWLGEDESFYSADEALPSVTGHTCYTAQYDGDPLYTVTFSVGESSFTGRYVFGESPVFAGNTDIADDSFYTYEFLGWRCGSLFVEPGGVFPAVNKSMTYVALYEKTYIFPISSSGAEVTLERGYVVADCVKGGTNIDFSVISDYMEKHEGYGLRLKMKLGTVTIDADTLSDMLAADDTVIGIETMLGALSRYKINVYNKNTDKAASSYGLERVEFSYSGSYSSATTHLYRGEMTEAGRTYFTYKDGTVSFAADSGVQYLMRDDYTVSLRPSSFGDGIISVSGSFYGEGDEVTVNVNLPEGVALDGVYYYDYVTGEPCEIKGQGGVYKLVMPSYNISIGVACSYKQYTVTFMSGSSVLVTYRHRWGDTVIVPADPVKVGYSFEGWSPEISPVTSDAVYNAVFVKLDIRNEDGDNGDDSLIGRLLYAGTVCYYMIIYLVIPAAVLGLAVLIIERRKYLPKRRRRK